MDTEPPYQGYDLFQGFQDIISENILVFTIVFVILLLINFLLIVSQNTIFELSDKEIKGMEKNNLNSAQFVSDLKKRPDYLSAGILSITTFINILLIILADYLLRWMFGPIIVNITSPWINHNIFNNALDVAKISSVILFLISICTITFILMLAGILLPQMHVTEHKTSFVRWMSKPLQILLIISHPMTKLLLKIASLTEHRFQGTHVHYPTSREDLDTAIDLAVTNTSESSTQEADILKGIVNFGDTAAKQIMRSRLDVIGLDIESDYTEVLQTVKSSGFSRLPVYSENLDNIKGILYVKDLLAFTDKDKNFHWQSLIRNTVFFVPESKKIDELLREFQFKRMHMAIIVDEYGGTMGIATLEDIMEEVVGDIKDEFDVGETSDYVKIDESHYIFEGKTLLNDVCRIIGESTGYFDNVKGEADSIGGLILEIEGMIPGSNEETNINNIKLKVISATKRRIEKVSLQIFKNA